MLARLLVVRALSDLILSHLTVQEQSLARTLNKRTKAQCALMRLVTAEARRLAIVYDLEHFYSAHGIGSGIDLPQRSGHRDLL